MISRIKAGEPVHVAVSREHPMVPQEDHDERKADDADEGPQHLLIGCTTESVLQEHALGEVQSVDHHQAQPVQQRDNGEKERVGVRCESPHREMRTGEQRQVCDGVLRQVPTQTLFLVGLDEQQGHRGDDRGEAEQEQLGVAPVRQRGSDGHG